MAQNKDNFKDKLFFGQEGEKDIALKLIEKGFKVEKHICKGLGHGISVDGLSRASEFIKNLYKNRKFRLDTPQ